MMMMLMMKDHFERSIESPQVMTESKYKTESI